MSITHSAKLVVIFQGLILAFWLFSTPQMCIKESSSTSLYIRFIAPLLSKRIERNNLSGFCPEHKNISTWFHSHQGFRDLLSPFHYKDRLSRYEIYIMKIRRLREGLIFAMGDLILIRRFSIELALTMLYKVPIQTIDNWAVCIVVAVGT